MASPRLPRPEPLFTPLPTFDGVDPETQHAPEAPPDGPAQA